MICKLSKGKGTNRGFRGLFEYLQHGPRGEKLNRGHVLATNLAGTSPREWSREIAAFRQLRPSLGKAVFHASLSLAPEDRLLSDAEFSQLASRFLTGMGFENSPFLIVRHHDTPSHQHIHLVASRIDCNGKVVSDARDYQRAEALMRKLEAEFDLRRITPSHNQNNKGANMDSKRRAYAAEDADGQKQNEAAAACVAESGEPLDEKRKRDFKRQLLEESYQQQISDMLAAELAYVRKSGRSLEIKFKDGGKVYDDGDRVRAYGDDNEASARRVVQLCKAKGWGAVKFQGNDAFLRAAMREALAAGLKVAPADDHQAELLAEIIREQAGQAIGLRCEPVSDIPPLAVLGLKSRLGNFRRERDEPQQTQTDSHRPRRPRF